MLDHLLLMLDYLLLMLLLFLPRYYASQAIAVISLARRADGSPDAPVIGGDDNHEILQTPAPIHFHPGARPSPMLSNLTVQDMIVSNRSTELRQAWNKYVNRCKAEWIIISSFSFTFLVASPAALQMAHDPVTRFFIYLTIFRAISAIAYSAVPLIYLGDPDTETAQFAKAWAKGPDTNKEAVNRAPWVIVALPAVALFWGAITLILAFISSVWYGGTSNTAYSSIGLTLQLTVTMFLVGDLCCLFWVLAVFKTVKRVKHSAADSTNITHSANL